MIRGELQAVIVGEGRIVAEFFDIGHSRTRAWAQRPQAAALLNALADPGRGFDAMVVGSSERAFYGAQFAQMAPLFAHYGVALWIADAGGAVDPGFLADDGLMTMLGMLSKREVIRARIRVQNAMTVQTAATPTPPKPQSTPTRNTGAQARPQNQ